MLKLNLQNPLGRIMEQWMPEKIAFWRSIIEGTEKQKMKILELEADAMIRDVGRINLLYIMCDYWQLKRAYEGGQIVAPEEMERFAETFTPKLPASLRTQPSTKPAPVETDWCDRCTAQTVHHNGKCQVCG